MSQTYSFEAAVRRFVRGELAWQGLLSFGVLIQIEGSSIEITCDAEDAATIQLTDVVDGLLKWQSDPQELQLWAAIIQGAANFIDLEERFESREGEVLLEALWNAAFGGTVDETAIELAKRIRYGQET